MAQEEFTVVLNSQRIIKVRFLLLIARKRQQYFRFQYFLIIKKFQKETITIDKK